MKKFLSFCLLLSTVVFVLSCGDSGKTENTSVSDGDVVIDEDADAGDEDVTDTEDGESDDDSGSGDTADDTPDTTPVDDGDTEDSGKKQGELYGRCYPNKTCNEGLVCDEENDTCIKEQKDDSEPADDSDSASDTDTDSGTDDDVTVIDDNDSAEPDNDNDSVIEGTADHKISGTYQIGSSVSGIEAALYECGKTDKIASGNTDAKGKFSFTAAVSSEKSYCIKANGFVSCFKGVSDHVANISEITNAVLLVDPTCADLRKSETEIRTYAKLGTGEWLGELDYTKLSGISEGMKLLSTYIASTDSKTLSEKIAEDAVKENPEFAKFFNGFRVFSDKKEIIIGESDDISANFGVEGGSSKVAPGFKISWTLKNKSAEAATYKFTATTPGEYTARAKLTSGSGDPIMLSNDSATVLFLQRKGGGTVYLNSRTDKNISFRIDDGIYGVIPKNTVVKKNGKILKSITYDILTAGGGQISRLLFGPEGAEFTGDKMYFVYELGTVYGGDPQILSVTRTNGDGTVDVLQSASGDPIMLAASGDPIMTTASGDPIMLAASGDPIMTAASSDPIMTSASGDPIMTSASGDPIMTAASGDPIMTSASGDPIMLAASGDPIMMGTSSSVTVTQTNHYSTFTLESASLPVSVEELLKRWCDGSFYDGYSPIEFIKEGVKANKPESTLLPYLTCEKFGDLGNDLYELMNRQIGFQRNLNLFENLFFVSEFYKRSLARQGNGTFVAVRNGLDLRSAIAALYTATTSYNRSTTLADMFDPSMIPLTYSGVVPEDYSVSAKKTLTGIPNASDKYAATKKEMMIFANYITTSSKGPDFSGAESVLNPDQLVCAWFNPDTPAQNCSKVYTVNEAGHVTLGGTEVSVAEANAIFTKYFMPMNSRLSDDEKLNLFRTLYLALKYAGTIFYNGTGVEELNSQLLKTAYLVFDGIDGNAHAVSIVDTFDASAHTVSVLEGAEMVTRPYVQKLSALTDKISLKVAAESANVEKVLISIEGKEFEKVNDNTRTYYKPTGDLKEKSIVLTPGTLNKGEKALKELLGSENVDELGNITGKMTIVANSKISGKTYSTQKTYEFFANDDSDGVESRPVPANLEVALYDSETGAEIPDSANPFIILNPGSRVYYPVNGVVSITELAPASYTIEAFADGYFAKNSGVNVPAGATLGVGIMLDKEVTSSADAELELSIGINSAKHPSKVYVQIYNEDMDLVVNESAKFDKNSTEESMKYETLNIAINSGRYTLLVVGEELYRYLETITVYPDGNTKEITVVAKNACGNGIIDSAEDCEPAVLGSDVEVKCSDIYPSSPNPDKKPVCNKQTCVYDKRECGEIAHAICGDGKIDSGEGCDGGAKACAEIAGFGNSTGSAPCATNCIDWETAGNCKRTTESCGNLPANAQWNDGNGTFEQTHAGGNNWTPATKDMKHGTTKEECVFSCTKGYKWNGTSCIDAPLSLGLICTGETGCFDTENETECPAYGEAFFGQDAQYMEAGFCTPHDFAEEGSGDKKIIKDKYTHYEWTAAASENAMSWSEAVEHCSDVNNIISGSTAVWRLPSPAELLTIVNSGTASPALVEKFTTYGHTFWADEDKRESDSAWKIDETGALASVAKTESHHVLCVRVHEYTPVENRFTAENETVKDNESGLMWQKQPVASRTWTEALNYCEEVSTADKFDWRLPNRNELASLVNYEKANGAASDFPAIAAKGFWTSTTDISASAKAWTVDFADGSIKSANKADTKYIICVKNDEHCFGSECPNACGFDQCKDMANSTGLCTADGYDFTCGCKSGFNWNHAKCLLDTTRYVACDGLPENAIWNTVFGISQTYDGDKWYPSNVGTFNKIASNVECRFVCATNYKWDADEEKCLPVSRPAECSEKKPYSEWNVVSRISQTWDGEKWEPSSESKYNEEASEEECRFICKEHYNWDAENNLCDPERQPAACIGLPANAHWWNDSATITQTWTNGGWAPSATGSHSTDAEENKCYFTCDANYEWNDTSCVAKTQTANCVTTTDNSEWTGGYSSITQTWNGSEWFPSEIGTYNTEKNPAYCRFKCKENYNWNGANCEPATQIATCTGLPEHATWNKVSSITQTFTNGSWSPSNVGTFGNETATECHFKCNDNYNYDNGTGKCLAGTQTASCVGLPSNAQWINSTVTQTWSDSLGWTPAAAGHHKSVSADGCSFECETDHYIWDSGTSTCVGKTITNQNCTGKPGSAVWNTVSKISQTWSGSAWLPALAATYNENPAADECRFKCPANYEWNGSDCIARTQIVSCGTLPANAAWNTVSQIKQTWNGSTEKWEPVVNLVHNDVSSETECRYTCKENYEFKNGACAPKKQTVACTGLPANAQWFYETVEQTWNGTTWHPATTGIHASDGNPQECRFHCIAENDQYKWDNNSKLCVANTKTGQQCTGLKPHAHWNQYSAISQTWNGTEWFPSTAGTYSATADETRCYFSCDENYEWDGAACVGATKTANCTGLPDHAVYNTVSSITQTYNGTAYMPELTASYCDNASTEKCCFKCLENYTVSNDQKSCVPATRSSDCTGLPDNAEWNTELADGQITQEWNGSDWAPVLTGIFGGQDAPAANSCIFKCIENYEWQSNLCVAKKQTSSCQGLPENAQWNSVATVLQEWKGAAWEPSDIGIFSEEESLTECRYKCKENYSWDGNGSCVPDTRVVECLPRPAHSVWNEVYEVTQTWSGMEWLPDLEPKYSVSASDTECLYKCDSDYYPLDGECVDNPCNHNGYNPCDNVANSTGICINKENMLLPYSCECDEGNGYYWHGRTGCRKGIIGLGNICTDVVKCFDALTEIGCPAEGNAFHGQDAFYADAGYCTPKNFVTENIIINGINHATIIDKNTGLEWSKDGGVLGKSWEQAADYCGDLEYGGHTDWRLPSVKELQTIINYAKSSPSLDTDYFGESARQHRVWSNMEVNASNAWILFAQTGETTTLSKTNTATGFTLCVRGEEDAVPGNSFEELVDSNENGESVIKDSTTKLYWQKTTSSNKTWQAALDYCDNLNYGGYSDWRLPDINELLSLVNYEKAYPASDFPGSSSGTFWTSTTNTGNASQAFRVAFGDGRTLYYTKTNLLGVRCVRSDLCDEGRFWDGANCAVSPCVESTCLIDHSDGNCIPLTSSKYFCGCEDGFIWDEDLESCLADPCFDNVCTTMEGSDGICTRIDSENFICGCDTLHFWNGSRCMKKRAFGNICTNQSRCFNETDEIICPSEGSDFYGQDAQYAAKGTCNPQSFDVSEIGENLYLAEDRNTGLKWQVNNNNYSTLTWYQALDYCKDLEYAGASDWRLPKVYELYSIVDFDDTRPSFLKPRTRYFWTSVSLPNSKDSVYVVESGGNGRAPYNVTYTKETTLHTMCVRDVFNLPKNDFVVSTAANGNEIVTDRANGLVWQKGYVSGKTWKEALAYCESSNYAGYTDWRLPNANEAFSLSDVTKNTNPRSYFPGDLPNSGNYGFWTSTTMSTDYTKARTFEDYTGDLGYVAKTTALYVRCVR